VAPVWPKFRGNDEEFARAKARGSFWNSYGRPASYKVEQFNLANLPNPVPASAYYAAMGDSEDPNSYATITDDTYNPYLAVKQRVLMNVDPAWSSCKQGFQGMLDPPVVLHAIGSLAAPTLAVPTLAVPTLAVPAQLQTNPPKPLPPAAPAPIQTSSWPTQTKFTGEAHSPTISPEELCSDRSNAKTLQKSCLEGKPQPTSRVEEDIRSKTSQISHVGTGSACRIDVTGLLLSLPFIISYLQMPLMM
jgi:hypothetical protein